MRLLSCTAAVAALVLSGPTLALAQTATAPAPEQTGTNQPPVQSHGGPLRRLDSSQEDSEV